MTPKELEKRIDVLENRITPKESPSIWIRFIRKDGKEVPVKGWKIDDDHLFLREPGETDAALRDRVRLLSEKYKNPPNGQMFLPIV
jgi:hypothetical protein